MDTRLAFRIQPQPDDTTCGPTCLQAVYAYYGDIMPLSQVIEEVPKLRGGGTLEVLLATHALRRGYNATIYTYNLTVFDPTWFTPGGHSVPDISDKLRQQAEAKANPKTRFAAKCYLEYLRLGGKVRYQDLTLDLLKKYLTNSIPVLSGLSATHLYRTARETEVDFDDVRGEPSGHFVVVYGYRTVERKALVADPLLPNPMAPGHLYEVSLSRLNCAIMLGVITFDASLLIITPGRSIHAGRT